MLENEQRSHAHWPQSRPPAQVADAAQHASSGTSWHSVEQAPLPPQVAENEPLPRAQPPAAASLPPLLPSPVAAMAPRVVHSLFCQCSMQQ